MPWYENPTIAAVLGALAGALISGLISALIWRSTKKIKRVDCFIKEVSSLLSISDKIKDQLLVSFDGKAVETVYLIFIDIVNTGNDAVEYQPVKIRLDKESQIIDYSARTNPPVGFGELVEIQMQDNCLDLQIALLNPGDVVSLEIVSIDNSSEEVEVYMKNANVQSRVTYYDDLAHLIKEQTLMSLAFMTVMPFSGFTRTLINAELAQRIGKRTKKK